MRSSAIGEAGFVPAWTAPVLVRCESGGRLSAVEDDWVSDERYEEALRARGRLAWRRRAVDATGFEALVHATEPVLRVRYAQAGTVQGPNENLAEVVVTEDDDAVTIALFERTVVGVYPDGWEASEKLMKVSSFVEVVLAAPLDGRAVIDAATGQRVAPLPPRDDVSERLRYGPRGCPRWLSE